jgi:hypothetical protein
VTSPAAIRTILLLDLGKFKPTTDRTDKEIFDFLSVPSVLSVVGFKCVLEDRDIWMSQSPEVLRRA